MDYKEAFTAAQKVVLQRVAFHSHLPEIHTGNEVSTRKHSQFFVLFSPSNEVLYARSETGLLSEWNLWLRSIFVDVVHKLKHIEGRFCDLQLHMLH